MKTKLFFFAVLLMALDSLRAQDFQEQFNQAIFDDSIQLQEKILDAWRLQGGDSEADYHVARFNYFFRQAFVEGMHTNTSYPPGEENVMVMYDSTGTAWYMYMGFILMDSTLVDSAMAEIAKGIACQPNRMDVYLGGIYTLLTAERWNAAIDRINAMIDYSRKINHQWMFDQEKAGVKEMVSAVEDYLAKLFSSVDLNATIPSDEEEQRLLAVRSIATQLHEIDPRDVISLNFIAASYSFFFDYKTAQPFLEKAFKIDKKDCIVLSNLYDVATHNEDKKMAKKALKNLKRYCSEE